MLVVHILNPRIVSVGDNDNRQIDCNIYSCQKALTYIKSVQIKWGNKSNVVGVHVLNPKMMTVDVDNIQTARQLWSIQKAHTLKTKSSGSL